MTLCEQCQRVDEPTRKLSWWAWRCLASPKDTPVQWVVDDPWRTEPPFEKCKDVNHDGKCELFEMRKEKEDA